MSDHSLLNYEKTFNSDAPLRKADHYADAASNSYLCEIACKVLSTWYDMGDGISLHQLNTAFYFDGKMPDIELLKDARDHLIKCQSENSGSDDLETAIHNLTLLIDGNTIEAAILSGYLRCVIFMGKTYWLGADGCNEDTPLDDAGFSVDDIASESRAKALADIKQFITSIEEDKIKLNGFTWDELEQLGADLLFSQTGSGVSFMDHEWLYGEEMADRLYDICKDKFGCYNELYTDLNENEKITF